MSEFIKNEVWASKIATASPTELISIAYDLIVQHLQLAAERLAEKDFYAFENQLFNAQNFLYVLVDGLDMRYEPAHDLLRLYMFINKNILTAKIVHKARYIEDIYKVLSPLQEAFAQIAAEDTQGSVMQNTAKLYAGLTYGKGSLTENTLEASNRGYKV